MFSSAESSASGNGGESKYSTCPARLGRRSSLKRDSNQISLWELQEAMLNDSTAAAAVESSEVPRSRLSGSSAHSGDYGSWPRSRKQRIDEGSPRRSVLSMWTIPDAPLVPLAPHAPLAPAAPAATSEAVTLSGSVVELDAMCLSAVAADDASEGIALATLEAMARELSAEAESETECESEVGEDKQAACASACASAFALASASAAKRAGVRARWPRQMDWTSVAAPLRRTI